MLSQMALHQPTPWKDCVPHANAGYFKITNRGESAAQPKWKSVPIYPRFSRAQITLFS